MTYTKITNFLLLGVAADTKPTTYPAGTVFIESDTGNISQYSGSAWSVIAGTQRTETLQNKTISASSNTITDTSAAVGDILSVSSGTSFKRLGKGTANQVLQTNSGATAIAWSSLTTLNIGSATGTANGSSTAFTIAHSIGSSPSFYIVNVVSTLGSTIAYSLSADSTNITVTFASAPSSGTITFMWMASP